MNENQQLKPKYAAFLLIILISIILFSIISKFYTGIRSSIFNRLIMINIALIDKNGEVGLLLLSPQQISFLKFPDDEILITARGYGSYPVNQIIKPSDDHKGDLVKESLQESYNIPVYGFILLNDSFGEVENYKNWTRDILWKNFQSETISDLNKKDSLIILNKIILKNKRLFSKKEFNKNSFYETFKDQKLREEGLSIEILNSTGHDGLAKRYSDLFENIGGRVIRLADYEPVLENCQILVNNPEAVNSYTVGVLSASTGCWVGKRGKEENRADITVIIGEDYWNKLTQKW